MYVIRYTSTIRLGFKHGAWFTGYATVGEMEKTLRFINLHDTTCIMHSILLAPTPSVEKRKNNIHLDEKL